MPEPVKFPQSIAFRAVIVALVLLGIVLAGAGGYLVMLGGSWYYLLAGLALTIAGGLGWTGRRAAWTLAAGTVWATIGWALWESGADFWALVPRLWPFLLIQLWLLLPGSVRRMGGYRPARALVSAVAGIAVSAAAGLALHHATGMELRDPALARGTTVAQAPDRAPRDPAAGEWRSYGNDAGGGRFSPLDQITPANVGRLEPAWTHLVGYGRDGIRGNLEVTPIKVGARLFACTPYDDVIAMDPVSGQELWRFHSGTDRKGFQYNECRGVAYYAVPGQTGFCAERIYRTTFAGALFALDAASGRLCPGFGQGGKVNLHAGMGRFARGYYQVSSAPTVAAGNIVLGGFVADGQYWGEPPGVIRAFDAVTGKFAWAFDPGHADRTGEPPAGETYTLSTPNSWAPMSVDEELGLVYAPTGNSVPDYFGGQRRPFDDAYSSSVLALDARTGKLRWSFQTVHHDLWDYDVASQPSLVDVGGRKVIVISTKRAQIFMLDRATGKPVSPVVERPVPTDGGVPGERIAPTQPYSAMLPDMGGPRLAERMMWGLTPIDQLLCRIAFRQKRYAGDFTPPGLQANIIYPGYAGGMDWGSAAFDKDRGLMIVNTTRAADGVALIPRSEADRRGVKPMSGNGHADLAMIVPQANTPYAADVRPFLSVLGAPCQQPPYGMLSAIDLASGRIVWSHPIGSAREAGPLGLHSRIPLDMGMPTVGGSIATRGGVTFISATKDATFRAFETATGKLLWSVPLPAGGNATPMTYMGRDGYQYVVIAAGGHAGTQGIRGNHLLAFRLPREAVGTAGGEER